MTISITTATLNARGHLESCLASVAAERERGVAVEHVVADGGSTDGTVELAESYGCVVLTGKDRGIYDALNKATRASTGDVIGCLGADDRLAPGALNRVLAWYRNGESDWVIGDMRWVDAEDKSLGIRRAPPRWMTPEMYASLGWSCVNHQATYMTRAFFDHLEGFDTDFRVAGDYEFFARALLQQRFDPSPGVLADFRMHGGNASAPGGGHVPENRRIAEAYGPASPVRRRIYRTALRVWINARNPDWFVHKRLRPDIYGAARAPGGGRA